jgi:SAM-dependent methyltransferase
MSSERIIDLYQRHARTYEKDRARGSRKQPRLEAFMEKPWLDRFIAHLQPGATVLDIGCGVGEPLARYLIEQRFHLVGVDAAASMIAICRTRFPECEWVEADMRSLSLGRLFGGLLAWDSFFHLTADDQRTMFPLFASHALSGAPLLFTSGPIEGVAIGCYGGEPLYHASLEPGEYERLLSENGFSVQSYQSHDQDCGGHTVWLARRAERLGDEGTKGLGD